MRMQKHFEISKKKLKELISEERQASKMYKHYGFLNISKDESKHRKELLTLLKKRRK